LLDGLAKVAADVVLLDVSMPGATFLDTLRAVREGHPTIKVLVLSVHSEDQWAVRALRAGASGYLTKDHSPDQLLEAVRRVYRGGKYVSPTLAEQLATHLDGDGQRALHELLSDREFEVMRRLGSGLTVSQIATELSLSAKTVSTYRTRIMEKMALSTNADLVRYAARYGLIS
jgi:DNA-binding NarL/FixJ family response regulator